jgi:hypothetical protein
VAHRASKALGLDDKRMVNERLTDSTPCWDGADRASNGGLECRSTRITCKVTTARHPASFNRPTPAPCKNKFWLAGSGSFATSVQRRVEKNKMSKRNRPAQRERHRVMTKIRAIAARAGTPLPEKNKISPEMRARPRAIAAGIAERARLESINARHRAPQRLHASDPAEPFSISATINNRERTFTS